MKTIEKAPEPIDDLEQTLLSSPETTEKQVEIQAWAQRLEQKYSGVELLEAQEAALGVSMLVLRAMAENDLQLSDVDDPDYMYGIEGGAKVMKGGFSLSRNVSLLEGVTKLIDEDIPDRLVRDQAAIELLACEDGRVALVASYVHPKKGTHAAAFTANPETGTFSAVNHEG